MNRYRRHHLLKETNFYLSKHSFAKNISHAELRDQFKNNKESVIEQGLNMAIAKLPGTDPAWHQETLNLSSMCLNLDTPFLFFTSTFAELHDPNFHRLLANLRGKFFDSNILDYKDRKRFLNKHLHIAAWYFAQRFSSFMRHVRKVFDASWYWQRQEMAGRLIPHGHGILGSKKNRKFIEQSATALLGF